MALLDYQDIKFKVGLSMQGRDELQFSRYSEMVEQMQTICYEPLNLKRTFLTNIGYQMRLNLEGIQHIFKMEVYTVGLNITILMYIGSAMESIQGQQRDSFVFGPGH